MGLLERVAEELGVPAALIRRRGLRRFISEEIQSLNVEINRLRKIYGVSSSAELEEKIMRGEIVGENMWDDLRRWQSFEMRKQKIEKIIREYMR